MKSSELRLGNWVQYKSSVGMQPTKVTSINEIGIDLFVHDYHPHDIRADLEYKDVEGIPLIPEILEKAGFEATWLSETGEQSYYRINDKNFLTSDMKLIWFGTEVNYLHQLQNLYFTLTGQELNIEL